MSQDSTEPNSNADLKDNATSSDGLANTEDTESDNAEDAESDNVEDDNTYVRPDSSALKRGGKPPRTSVYFFASFIAAVFLGLSASSTLSLFEIKITFASAILGLSFFFIAFIESRKDSSQSIPHDPSAYFFLGFASFAALTEGVLDNNNYFDIIESFKQDWANPNLSIAAQGAISTAIVGLSMAAVVFRTRLINKKSYFGKEKDDIDRAIANIEWGKIFRLAGGVLIAAALLMSVYYAVRTGEQGGQIRAALYVLAFGISAFGIILMYELFRPDESDPSPPEDGFDIVERTRLISKAIRVRSKRLSRGAAMAIGALILAVGEFLVIQIGTTAGLLDAANRVPSPGETSKIAGIPSDIFIELLLRFAMTTIFVFLAAILIRTFRNMMSLSTHYHACADLAAIGDDASRTRLESMLSRPTHEIFGPNRKSSDLGDKLASLTESAILGSVLGERVQIAVQHALDSSSSRDKADSVKEE